MPDLKAYSPRKCGTGFGGYIKQKEFKEFNIDQSQMMKASLDRSKEITKVNFTTMRARDLMMYTQGEFYKNINLDNTKELREQ